MFTTNPRRHAAFLVLAAALYAPATTHGGGACLTGADCNDGNPCTNDSCIIFVCTHSANSNPCNDGFFCNGPDACSGGACVIHAGDPCPGTDGDSDCTESCNETTDQCNAPDVNNSVCNDGLFCTQTDRCSNGNCVGTGNPCPGPDGDSDCSESCNEAANNCTGNDPNSTPCQDGLFCTLVDRCSNGSCVGTGNPCPGADGDADCTESCNEAGDNCAASDPDGAACTDGSACTGPDTCVAGTCVAGAAAACDDGVVCTVDACDPGGGCTHTSIEDCCATDADCRDADACNGIETCDTGAGTCQPGTPLTCDDGAACTRDVCRAAEGCVAAPITLADVTTGFLGALQVLSCEGATVPASIGRLFTRANQLVARAVDSPPKAKRFLKKAGRTLRQAGAKTQRAGGRKVPLDCAAALGDVIDGARTRTDCLLANL